MTRTRTAVFLWICLTGILFLQSCSRKETAPRVPVQQPNTITVGSIGDAQRLLPPLASDSASGDISGWVFNGLIKYDKDIHLVGDLAESFESSSDCRTVTFHLRKGVKWHDGADFTADDVQFTYRTMIDPKTATPYSGDFERVKELTVVDPYTLRVTYKEPFAPGLASWGMGIVPKHLLAGKDINASELNRKPVGTGPYKFGEWVSGQRIVLAANDQYFEGRPHIDQFVYRIIPDTSTMFLELKAGGLDHMGLTPLLYQRQTDTPLFKTNFNKFKYPAFSYTYLGYNLRDPKFSDKRVRQAIAHAIDKKSIILGVLLGLGRPATGPFPPESWAYNQEVRDYPMDIEKAKQLLGEAGWKDTDGDGLLDRGGNPFRFTLLVNQGNEERAKIAEIIQQNLNKVGIKVEIKVVEWQALLHEFIDKRKFEAIIMGWSLGRDPDNYDIFHSSKTKEGEFNFVSYKNPRVDTLLLEGQRTCDQEKRKAIYHEIHQIIADDQPYTFLYYPEALPVIHKRFQGVAPAPIGIWYNFIEWNVPKDWEKMLK